MLDGFFENTGKKKTKKKEVQKTKEQIAWETKDWDALDKILAETKTKEPNTFFDVLNSINFDKKELDIDNYCPSYSQYLVNLGLSQHVDALPYVEHMNLYGKQLTPQMHYNFYMLALPKKKRFGKWPKAIDNLEDKFIDFVIRKTYNVGAATALRYKIIMSEGNMLNKFIERNLFYLESSEVLKELTTNKTEQNKLKDQLIKKYKKEQ